MITNLQFEVAHFKDIDGVLALQDLYLVSNLSEEEKEFGFVTTPFSVGQLTEVISKQELFVVKDNDIIIAYLFSGSWQFFSQWPIFEYMTTLFPNLHFLDYKITMRNSFQYGPICIDKKYRGKGLIKPLFELMRINLMQKYPLALTFINKKNIPSTKAHTEKLHWTAIGDFQFNNNDYHIMAYNMIESIH